MKNGEVQRSTEWLVVRVASSSRPPALASTGFLAGVVYFFCFDFISRRYQASRTGSLFDGLFCTHPVGKVPLLFALHPRGVDLRNEVLESDVPMAALSIQRAATGCHAETIRFAVRLTVRHRSS